MSLALDAAELAKLPPPEVDSVESSPVESCDEEYERSAVAALIVLSSLAEQHATAQGVVPCRRTPSTEWESAGSQSDSPRVVRRKLGDGGFAPGARFQCRYPGCGKFYASTDAVRKHCRKRHNEWLGQLDQVTSGRPSCGRMLIPMRLRPWACLVWVCVARALVQARGVPHGFARMY
ncbi:hypothetical protein EMIHUDRAFT_453396 [Emiliania huxleyi CCMP1516]|uniref:C2H2-type domain-containing protein n=2 Tax=Emiliania huxleyi TaxID=2903 RepID=A0A0D3I681_EMIH1|nr:hypothetical protein EMIHUDRAFT_453396 [Emiliania huxleyi CCMP1516]EOD06766.1 hypothetical protein EMIHUDRAFT_453396 [Emiliania huxleyi CCMP1516]|eukprot:XP_005759195.1 hypothetical protein EMIHUDRAFT_453396 [Emiliania huxleyi CCMP1516]